MGTIKLAQLIGFSLGLPGLITVACASEPLGPKPCEHSDSVFASRWESGTAPWCIARKVDYDTTGYAACRLFVGRESAPAGGCDCAGPGRAPIEREGCTTDFPGSELAAFACVCELTQLFGTALAACQRETSEPSRAGWCFLDGAESACPKPTVTPELLAECQAPYRFRFVGRAGPQPGEAVFLSCYSDLICDLDVDTGS